MFNSVDDKKLFAILEISLKKFCNENGFTFKHTPFPKQSGSLYRFGWFYINGYRYSISGWKFKDGLVTFERDDTNEKIKYSIPDKKIKNGIFKKDSFIEKNVKHIRKQVSIWLKDLSDKLHP